MNTLKDDGDVQFNNETHLRDLSRIEEMSRLLKDLKKRLNKASMQCHLLNIDVVTQFNPYQVETLKAAKYDCLKCIERMEKREQDI